MSMNLESATAPAEGEPQLPSAAQIFEAGGMSLDLPPGLSVEAWHDVGRRLSVANQRLQWLIGDWWAYGDHAYGARAKDIAEKIFGKSWGYLRNMGVVARRFEPSRRHDANPFAHHAEVATLPDTAAHQLLEVAARENWSAKDLRAEVGRLRVPEQPPQQLPQPYRPDAITRRLGVLVRAAFADWFGLGESRTNLLAVLFEAGGEPIETRRLAALADSHRPMTQGALHEAIHVLRDAFEVEAIDRTDDGYSLSEIGLTECRNALAEAASMLLAAAEEPANDNGAEEP